MSTPVVALETQSLLEQYSNDRPVFHGRLSRGLRSSRFFQVFGCHAGFLCLELAYKQTSEFDPKAILKWFAAIWFGVFTLMAHVLILRRNAQRESDLDLSNTLLSDDELIELARKQKHSFVARYEDIAWARIDPPDPLEQLCYGRKVQGTITFREKVVGKVAIQVHDRQSMDTAIEVFSRRLGDRVAVRLEFDPRRQRFVARRPK